MTREPLTESYWPTEAGEVREITLPELLREATAAKPDQLALVHGAADPAERREWTYTEFLADTEAAARALLGRYQPGDRIGIWAPNSAEWVILQQAIAMAGMIVVAANPAYRSSELKYMLQQSQAKALFYAGEYRGTQLRDILDEVVPESPELKDLFCLDAWDEFLSTADSDTSLPVVEPRDPVQIQYTSGTTGSPKGALLHHMGIVNEATLVGERAGNSGENGVCINAMPMYHIGGGAVTELQSISAHGTYVVVPSFDPGLILELFETYRGTHGLFVPTMLLALLDHPDRTTRDLSSITTLWTGAAPVAEALIRRVTGEFKCRTTILFGQTEMHGVISQTRVTDSPEDQAATVGQPLPELEVKVVDLLSDEVVPIGEQGEILCRGYQVMLEYFQNPTATAATITDDGWLRMGDIGVMDERGFLKITGRVKEMIIRGGMNIYPREIEDLLFDHPAVSEAVVTGLPHEQWGEEVAAVLRLRADSEIPTATELKSWCRERIAAHKTPAHWYITGSYPMTASGKIQKYVLARNIIAGETEDLIELQLG
ncbi:AMP-binding protein [Brevibacterium aurantiacum]|uniref:AMP-dependent synthetase n=1 Tax=Brevibacterium aurantiacum TaxID=273384 RepID=A0A4Z0KES6_BREAU|nr:AMP-binding protein [Brevibacterium aurantiacum]TGD37051.1 AMP-dependent synthetase [Brevibacterium aurantiacum]